ncbi:hypothetical protein A4R44_04046 [Amycolatopsis sp. M39]|nr:hypothetical protein A4R44_04046 [Amycolatopsis sp. M39]
MRHNPRAPLLWVGDDEDWKTAHEQSQALVCPEPDCDIELVAVENRSYRYNPRFFRFKSKSKQCGHWPARNRGGPETPQHDWVKARLAGIVRHLGHQATPEHWHTRADVFVHKPAFCLEVQLQSTQFTDRTASRQRKGAEVCWFLPGHLDSRKARAALFHGRGVRFRVVDRQSHRPIAPWESPDDRDLARRAIIEVWGTVAHPPRRGQEPDPSVVRPGSAWFRTDSLDGYRFLKEVLSGRRRWYPAETIGNKTGLWALDTDVTAYRDFRARQQDHLDQLHREQQARDARPEPPAPPAEAEGPVPLAGAPAVERDDVEEPPQVPVAEPDTVPFAKINAPTPRPAPAHAVSVQPRRRRWWQLWRRTP